MRNTLVGFWLAFMMMPVCLGQNFKRPFQQDIIVQDTASCKGTAVVITGAASRIAQEAALLEQLYLNGWLSDVTFISGASSGALNAVGLNAILSGKTTWEQYKQILFGVTSSQVYEQSDQKFPFNTQPLRILLTRIVRDSMGYSVVGDLPIPSAISATRTELIPYQMKTMRFSNRLINAESNPLYDLIDLLMASTAIPLVFPSVKNRDSYDFPMGTFIDGGVSDDRIPFEAVIENAKRTGVEPAKLVIVSRKSNSADHIRDELSYIGIKDSKRIVKMGKRLNYYGKDAFIKRLKELQMVNPGLALRTYIYIPDFKEDFPLLNFDTMEDQYNLTTVWARQNQPILLSEFVIRNQLQKNKIAHK